jgi:hypothetical protein
MELTDATVLCEPCWSQVPRNQKVVLFLRWVEWRAEPGDRAALRRLRRLIDDTITALPGR